MSHIQLSPPKGMADWLKLYRLYLSAFPASERKPFFVIVKHYRRGNFHIWCLRQGKAFRGLAITINGDALILLDYFAVEKACRGQGIGSAAIQAVQERYRDKGLFLEIESTLLPCPDLALRQRRKAFYQRAGLEELHTSALLFGVPMELMGRSCQLDFEGYRAFYRENYSPWAAEHIQPIPEQE